MMENPFSSRRLRPSGRGKCLASPPASGISCGVGNAYVDHLCAGKRARMAATAGSWLASRKPFRAAPPLPAASVLPPSSRDSDTSQWRLRPAFSVCVLRSVGALRRVRASAPILRPAGSMRTGRTQRRTAAPLKVMSRLASASVAISASERTGTASAARTADNLHLGRRRPGAAARPSRANQPARPARRWRLRRLRRRGAL